MARLCGNGSAVAAQLLFMASRDGADIARGHADDDDSSRSACMQPPTMAVKYKTTAKVLLLELPRRLYACVIKQRHDRPRRRER